MAKHLWYLGARARPYNFIIGRNSKAEALPPPPADSSVVFVGEGLLLIPTARPKIESQMQLVNIETDFHLLYMSDSSYLDVIFMFVCTGNRDESLDRVYCQPAKVRFRRRRLLVCGRTNHFKIRG